MAAKPINNPFERSEVFSQTIPGSSAASGEASGSSVRAQLACLSVEDLKLLARANGEISCAHAKPIGDCINVFTAIHDQLALSLKERGKSEKHTPFQVNISSLAKLSTTFDKWAEENTEALKHLKRLDLADMSLTYLPEGLKKLISVEFLDLRGNKFETLSPNLRALVKLKQLNLADNQIRELPDWIGDFQDLDILTLSNNELSSLPDTMANLLNLYQIELDGNKFTKVPDVLHGMHAIPGNGKRLAICMIVDGQNYPWPLDN